MSVGSLSIKKQAESRDMLRVTNEIGDFFRVAAKKSFETGKKYRVHFDLVGKEIEIFREEEKDKNGVGNGNWKDGGIKIPIEKLELPNTFEYGIKWGSFKQTFNSTMKSQGCLSRKFTMYIFKSNSSLGIQSEQKVKYAISFSKVDHIKYLYVREYIPIRIITSENIITLNKSPSENIENLKLIRD